MARRAVRGFECLKELLDWISGAKKKSWRSAICGLCSISLAVLIVDWISIFFHLVATLNLVRRFVHRVDYALGKASGTFGDLLIFLDFWFFASFLLASILGFLAALPVAIESRKGISLAAYKVAAFAYLLSLTLAIPRFAVSLGTLSVKYGFRGLFAWCVSTGIFTLFYILAYWWIHLHRSLYQIASTPEGTGWENHSAEALEAVYALNATAEGDVAAATAAYDPDNAGTEDYAHLMGYSPQMLSRVGHADELAHSRSGGPMTPRLGGSTSSSAGSQREV